MPRHGAQAYRLTEAVGLQRCNTVRIRVAISTVG